MLSTAATLLMSAWLAANPTRYYDLTVHGGTCGIEMCQVDTGGRGDGWAYDELWWSDDPMPIEDVCDQAVSEAIAYWCYYRESHETPPAYCAGL
jgi:hypothetical protein